MKNIQGNLKLHFSFFNNLCDFLAIEFEEAAFVWIKTKTDCVIILSSVTIEETITKGSEIKEMNSLASYRKRKMKKLIMLRTFLKVFFTMLKFTQRFTLNA